MSGLADFVAAVMSRATDEPSRNFAISFSGSKGAFVGAYALPGDHLFRGCTRPDGSPLYRETTAEAEADAGHALVAALQRLKRELNP